ncbi:hypothetical protein ElyMa_005991100 [Elysia marginata]|uniref:Uncharacterized protein n=1 Tax=Elysia marginata TaxID=1093978 RepID=A0AAV4GGF9_9GAST|nr:hypothetical protein ElyMa_005991100 [Elysia marginata]
MLILLWICLALQLFVSESTSRSTAVGPGSDPYPAESRHLTPTHGPTRPKIPADHFCSKISSDVYITQEGEDRTQEESVVCAETGPTVNLTFRFLNDHFNLTDCSITDSNVRYGPRNMPLEIASNGEVSYSMTNLDSALTMLMAVYVYGEEAVKDTKQIALRNTTVCVPHSYFTLYHNRNRTLLEHTANALYCSVHQSHQRCLYGQISLREPREDDKTYVASIEVEEAQNVSLTLSQVRKALEFLCRVRQGFDKKCVLGQLQRVESCIREDVLTIVHRKGQDWSYGILDPCRDLEVTAMCTFEILEVACTEKEARIMTSLMANYLRDPHCSLSNRAHTFGGWKINSLLLVAALATKLINV